MSVAGIVTFPQVTAGGVSFWYDFSDGAKRSQHRLTPREQDRRRTFVLNANGVVAQGRSCACAYNCKP
jgi:hypothetical protein